jgi:CheY-like chemotaxis protein
VSRLTGPGAPPVENLPITAREARPPKHLSAPEPDSGPAPGDGLRCVIIDDNERFVELAAELLVREGFEVVGRAGHSVDALRVIIETRPDIALIDLFLGDENGVELVTEIARLGLATRTRLLLISTCAPSDLREMFAMSAAHGYLSKLELSGELIRELLSKGPSPNGDGEHHGDRHPPT